MSLYGYAIWGPPFQDVDIEFEADLRFATAFMRVAVALGASEAGINSSIRGHIWGVARTNGPGHYLRPALSNVPGRQSTTCRWGAASTSCCVWIVYRHERVKRKGEWTQAFVQHDSVWLLHSEARARVEELGGEDRAACYGTNLWGSGAAALRAGIDATWDAQLVAELKDRSIVPAREEQGFHLYR